jgi:ABC-type antimicrobial peptide transport system permease subunit
MQIDSTLLQERLFARFSGFFAALALLLACVGLYGTLSYGVARRTSEIGNRMALGGRAGDIQGMIMRETLLVLVLGVVAGLPGMLAAARLASSVLFGVKPADLPTMLGAVGLLAAVSVLAGYIPARRASRVDPMAALKYE